MVSDNFKNTFYSILIATKDFISQTQVQITNNLIFESSNKNLTTTNVSWVLVSPLNDPPIKQSSPDHNSHYTNDRNPHRLSCCTPTT